MWSQKFILLFVSFFPLACWGADLVVSPNGLTVACSIYWHELKVSKAVRSYNEESATQHNRWDDIYRSSSYWTGSRCSQEAFRLRALVNLAGLSGKLIQFGSSDDIAKDFRIINADGSGVTNISPVGLVAACRDMDLDGLDKRFILKVSGIVIYATSRYEGLSSEACEEDRQKIQVKINAAQASGRFLNYRFGDAPNDDISVADEGR